jgi:hypothetical protein
MIPGSLVGRVGVSLPALLPQYPAAPWIPELGLAVFWLVFLSFHDECQLLSGCLCDSAFFAISCDVLLEASIIGNENSLFGLSGVWQAGLFDLESYYQRDRK